LFVLSLLIIEVIALFLYSKSKNRTDENFSISPIYYRTQKRRLPKVLVTHGKRLKRFILKFL
ncbi:hypothetical protein, partial [Staphylococcus aureus]